MDAFPLRVSLMKRAVLILSVLGLTAGPWSTFAAQLSGEDAPVPNVKPLGYLPQTSSPASIITGSIPRAQAVAPVNSDLRRPGSTRSNRNPMQAISIRDSMRQNTLGRHILTWAIVVSGQKGVPSVEDPHDRRQKLSGWPGLAKLRP